MGARACIDTRARVLLLRAEETMTSLVTSNRGNRPLGVWVTSILITAIEIPYLLIFLSIAVTGGHHGQDPRDVEAAPFVAAASATALVSVWLAWHGLRWARAPAVIFLAASGVPWAWGVLQRIPETFGIAQQSPVRGAIFLAILDLLIVVSFGLLCASITRYLYGPRPESFFAPRTSVRH